MLHKCWPGPTSLPNHQIQSTTKTYPPQKQFPTTKSLAGLPLRPHACWFIKVFRAIMDFLLLRFSDFFLQIIVVISYWHYQKYLNIKSASNLLNLFGLNFCHPCKKQFFNGFLEFIAKIVCVNWVFIWKCLSCLKLL